MFNESNLDLDIDNYSMNELKQFYNINNGDTQMIIESKINSLAEKYLFSNDTNYDNETKKNIYNFLEKSKKKVIFELLIYKNNSEIDTNIASGSPHYPLNIQNISKKYVNPIDIKTTTRLLIFNSKLCDNFLDISGNTSTLTFTLPESLRNVISCKLSLFQYYNVQYTFTALTGNNILEIHDDELGAKTIIVPDGSYDEATFPAILEQQINLAFNGYYYLPLPVFYKGTIPAYPNSDTTVLPPTPSFPVYLDASYLIQTAENKILYPSSSPPPPKNRYAVTINTNTYKMTILNTESIKFSIVFDKPTWDTNASNVCQTTNVESHPELYYKKNILRRPTLGYQCGFRNIVYKDSAIYMSESIYNEQTIDYVYFSMDDHNLNSSDRVIGVFPENFLDKKILALIPITTPVFTYSIDTGANFIYKTRDYIGPVNISKIDVQLYGPYGNILHLYNTTFSFGIEFTLQYDNPVGAGNIGAQQLM